MQGLAGFPYGGEPVDQLVHALEAAALAQAEGADEDLVLAALLHDVGRAPAVAERYPGLGHDAAGENFCREVLGDRVAWLVGSHAQAKRYLVTTDASYTARLTEASVRSLAVQGGPMSATEVFEFEAHPWAADAIRLRRWDDSAKDPGGKCADLGEMMDLYASHRITTRGGANAAPGETTY